MKKTEFKERMKSFVERTRPYWVEIILLIVIVIAAGVACKTYLFPRISERKEAEEQEAEQETKERWFGPNIYDDMVQEWNENGVRGWGNWSKETCDLLEKAIRADQEEKEQLRSNALALLNGSADSDIELDVRKMELIDFITAVRYMEYMAYKENLMDARGIVIQEGNIWDQWHDWYDEKTDEDSDR
ncbi:MAG: hypothetical protein K2N01_00325 [Lachnospiraceae bacterium]|nr:hypothetical protein [Lachnospiraceae bacterium]